MQTVPVVRFELRCCRFSCALAVEGFARQKSSAWRPTNFMDCRGLRELKDALSRSEVEEKFRLFFWKQGTTGGYR